MTRLKNQSNVFQGADAAFMRNWCMPTLPETRRRAFTAGQLVSCGGTMQRWSKRPARSDFRRMATFRNLEASRGDG